jgi:hypothetical protein
MKAASPLRPSHGSTEAISQHDADEYFCELCGALAEYGFGVSLAKNVRGRWYCAAHVPDEEPNGWIARPDQASLR